MSALVTSDEDEDWYTNSRTWSIILERAMAPLDMPARSEYERYANAIGIDFTLIEVSKRAQLASWLLAVIDDLQGPLASVYGWDTGRDRARLRELSRIFEGVIARNRNHIE